MATALALAGCEQATSGFDDARADPGDAVRVARGERVYVQHCAACHGAKLEGQPDWRRRLANGRLPAPQGYETDMPAFAGKLGDAEIWAVLAFIKSRWTSGEVRKARAQLSARAASR
jgi:mono/diheme cytochrome c family protein